MDTCNGWLLMSYVLDWFKGEKNRAAVALIGGGLVAIVGGGWTVATFPIDHHMDQPSPSSTILAEQKGIAIASDQDIRINAPVASNPNAKDYTPPILEQIEKLEGRQKETMSEIARKKGIANPPLLAILVKIDEKGVKVAEIAKLLDAKANELIKLRSKTDRLREGRAELAGIAQEVQSLIDKGELDAASKVLARAREAARTQRINASRDAAEILALDARIDDLQLAYRLAASKDGEAAVLVAPFDSVMRQGLLRKQASELYKQGEQLGDNGALAEAVDINRLLLTLTPRSTQPFRWANTQIHLGAALELLGERQGSTAQLDEAVAAYRETLMEKTRERDPRDWAILQANLGLALLRLGERESGTARLEEAVAAYGEALKEQPRMRVPILWAKSAGNQGVALMLIAERRTDVTMATTALDQIEAAITTARAGGDAPTAANFEAQMPKARSLLQHLAKH
jgi:tetratricopeptide (TPR) repeat protein